MQGTVTMIPKCWYAPPMRISRFRFHKRNKVYWPVSFAISTQFNRKEAVHVVENALGWNIGSI